jgi:hypothetical protein
MICSSLYLLFFISVILHNLTDFYFKLVQLGGQVNEPLRATPARIRTQAQEIGRQVATGAMPLGKLTTMTEDERAAVVAWINAGAPP